MVKWFHNLEVISDRQITMQTIPQNPERNLNSDSVQISTRWARWKKQRRLKREAGSQEREREQRDRMPAYFLLNCVSLTSGRQKSSFLLHFLIFQALGHLSLLFLCICHHTISRVAPIACVWKPAGPAPERRPIPHVPGTPKPLQSFLTLGSFPPSGSYIYLICWLSKHPLQDEEAQNRRIKDKTLAPPKSVGRMSLSSVGPAFYPQLSSKISICVTSLTWALRRKIKRRDLLFPQQWSLLEQKTGGKLLFIQGCYPGRPLTPELTESQLRKRRCFRAWDMDSSAALPIPGSLWPAPCTSPAPLLAVQNWPHVSGSEGSQQQECP